MVDVFDRFWRKVAVRDSDECWEWQGTKVVGYGTTRNNKQQYYAHRFSWEIHNGPIPADMFVCHHCDNRACVNPNHLFLGTNADNAKDAATKGRKGKRLNWEKVREIRRLYASYGFTLKELGSLFHVSHVTIWNVVNFIYWKE